MTTIDAFIDQWTDAERAGDVAVLDSLLTEDFVGVGPLGFTLPKYAWLYRHQQGDLRYDTFGLEDVETRVHGDTAMLTARQVARGAYQGHPTPESLRATLTLVHYEDDDIGSAWQMAGIHMSFIAGTPGAPPIPGGAA